MCHVPVADSMAYPWLDAIEVDAPNSPRPAKILRTIPIERAEKPGKMAGGDGNFTSAKRTGFAIWTNDVIAHGNSACGRKTLDG